MQSALLNWINTSFSLNLTLQWLSAYIQQEKSLLIVDAEPLEDSCAEISEGDLQENAKMLAEKIVAAHPELILNIDELGLDCKRDTHKLKIVSSNACPRVYLSPRAESHITFLCSGVFIDEANKIIKK